MRALILSLILAFITYAPATFAIQNLMNLCERNLLVDSKHDIKLAANQIALKGRLHRYWEAAMGSQMGWFIGDEFIRTKISPNGQNFVFWLSPGDRVFVQDAMGNVVASGYYGEVQEPLTDAAGKELSTSFNSPYLYADPELKEVALTGSETRRYFAHNALAVVVKTMSEREVTSLKERLGPAFRSYEINQASADRYIRVGRRRGFELTHFQTAKIGKANVKVAGGQQLLDFGMGIVVPGPTLYNLTYELYDGPTKIDLAQNDQIILLDENGLVTAEGMIGGIAFPWTADDESFVKVLQEQFKKAHSAFVAKVR